MKRPTLLALTMALAGMPANSQVARFHKDLTADTTTGNRVAAHMAAGGGWASLVVLINLGSTVANYTLRFYGDNGEPQAFSFKDTNTQKDLGTQSVLSGSIAVGGELDVLARDVGNATATGWALIDPSSTGDMGGAAIFGYRTGQEAVVAFETSTVPKFVLGFDNTAGGATGFALVNPHANPVTVNIVFRDYTGATLHTDQFQMSSMEHTSFVLNSRYASLAGKSGTALVSVASANDAIAGLAILANAAGAYTTASALTAQ